MSDFAEKDTRLTHAEKEMLRPILARYVRWDTAHDGPVFEAVEQILASRLTSVTPAGVDDEVQP